ncbi:MAG: family 16 glycosylhydrolase [Bacteroidales bacterium]|jgi:beta-glucanase (GH16 family)
MKVLSPVLKLLAAGLLLVLLQPASVMAQFNALVWSDEFDYTGLPAASRWTCEEGGSGWGNNELQYYTMNRTENARVENGVLIIEALRENLNGREYTSARLISSYKGDWLYGRFEVRAKVPGGKGTWPAIWMLPTDWAYGNWPASGEIDIMEHVGYDPTHVYGTAHTQAYNHKLGTQKGGSVTGTDWESAFHVYAIEWSATKIDFIVDDAVYYTFNNEGGWEKWPFDQRFHFILNLAVGGSWGGAQGVDNSIFPKRMEIDYVRVYQLANMKISGPSFLEPGQTATYQATRFPGAAYQWHVPWDAQITAGEGTSDITVRWGASEGDIACEVTIGTNHVTAAYPIKTVVVPAENTFWFGNLIDGNTSDLYSNTSDGSTYTFAESGESLKVVYTTVTPGSWPKFELTLPRPVNLKDHPYCVINLKTYNLSHSVSARFDFADLYGVETNATPVFRPTITADGLFHNYQNTYTGRWLSSIGQMVDSTRIIKLTTYINGGVFGIPNKTDSLWIESIRFLKNPLTSSEQLALGASGVHVFPNPANDRLTVSSNDIIDGIEVFDIRGTRIKKLTSVNSPSTSIDTGDLPVGIYVIRCRTAAGRIETGKFIKK